LYQFFGGENERKHHQVDGKENKEEGEYRVKIGW
jgi:hypothetical protein